MARVIGARRISAVATVALVAAVAAAALWWLHGRSTIVADWYEVGRCQSAPDRLGPRVTGSPDVAACSSPVTWTGSPRSEDGRVVVSVLLVAAADEEPSVRSISSDRATRRVVVAAGTPRPTGTGEGRSMVAVTTLVFVSFPRDALPEAPFVLADGAGEEAVTTTRG